MTLKYKVATTGNNWKRGFLTLAEAREYANSVWRRTGVFVAVVAYKAR